MNEKSTVQHQLKEERLQSMPTRQEGIESLSSDFDHVKHLDTFLPTAVATYGENKVLEKIEERLIDPRFKVDFYYNDAEEVLKSYRFNVIGLFYHNFIIPKPARALETVAKVKEVVEVMEFTESDEALIFSVYFLEGPSANTIEEAANSINIDLAPVVKKLTKRLGISDYSMVFKISVL